jgi:hypothetical protein
MKEEDRGQVSGRLRHGHWLRAPVSSFPLEVTSADIFETYKAYRALSVHEESCKSQCSCRSERICGIIGRQD